MSRAIRIGVDVGGTFTKAVAVETGPLRLLAHAVVPTSHEAEGVADGVVDALRDLLGSSARIAAASHSSRSRRRRP